MHLQLAGMHLQLAERLCRGGRVRCSRDLDAFCCWRDASDLFSDLSTIGSAQISELPVMMRIMVRIMHGTSSTV